MSDKTRLGRQRAPCRGVDRPKKKKTNAPHLATRVLTAKRLQNRPHSSTIYSTAKKYKNKTMTITQPELPQNWYETREDRFFLNLIRNRPERYDITGGKQN